MKIQNLNKLLSNKYILYLVTLIALINIFSFIFTYKTKPLAFFVLVGFITYYFTKNMIIVLLTSIILTNIFMMNELIDNKYYIYEGLENGDKSETLNEIKEKKAEVKSQVKKKVEDKKSEKNSQGSQETQETQETQEEEAVSGMSNMNSQNSKNRKYNIDYAATFSEAYNNLQNVLGEGGINGLTKETEKLIQQQQNLMTQMEGMIPLVDKAKSMIGGLNLDKFGDFLQKK